MKEDGLVLVTDDDGSLPIGETSPLGLYFHDTQFLSGFALRINGQAPALLSANTEQNYVGAFQLANRPATLDDGAILPSQSLSVRRTRFLADGLRERVGILNCNPGKVRLRIRRRSDRSDTALRCGRASQFVPSRRACGATLAEVILTRRWQDVCPSQRGPTCALWQRNHREGCNPRTALGRERRGA